MNHLRKAGIPVAFREFKGAWHGFEGIAMWTKIARDANSWRDTQFFSFLSHYFAPQDESIPKNAETNRVCDVFPDAVIVLLQHVQQHDDSKQNHSVLFSSGINNTKSIFHLGFVCILNC